MSQKIQFQEGDHGPESSPSEETPGHNNRKPNQIETPKKPIPVVLPVLPILPTPKSNSTDPIMNKTVREKPREPRCPRYFIYYYIFSYNIFSPSNHYQKEVRELKEQPSAVPSAVPHPQFSSKIDKYRKKVNEDKGEKKKDEKKIKEVKKEYPKAKPAKPQVILNYLMIKKLLK